MFCGHIDTVGVEGMRSPFDPREIDGRLYGRGSQDMKGGIAAMIDAARVASQRGLRAGRLIVAVVVDEEYASIGADALVREWPADAAVVTEPTDLQIGVAHKGFAWLEIETRGRAAHGSRPADGVDAIVRMGRVLGQLEALDRQLQSRSAAPATRRGVAARVDHRRRARAEQLSGHLPAADGTAHDSGRIATSTPEEEVRSCLERLRAEDATFDSIARVGFARPPYEIAEDHPVPEALARAAVATGVNAARVGMSFWTDAAVLGAAGTPSVLFGPGGAGLHSTEEYVTMAEVIACRDVLATLAVDWCASPPP